MSRIRNNYENSFRARFLRYIMGEDELPEKNYMSDFRKQIDIEKEEDEKATEHYLVPPLEDPMSDAKRYAEMSGLRWFRRLYSVMAVLLCIAISALLIYNVTFMPRFGASDSPMNNEVTERYLEKAGEETGTVNVVTGLILQYRGFDTFGETHVLFIATIAVMILLKMKKDCVFRRTLTDHCAGACTDDLPVRLLCACERTPFPGRRFLRRRGNRRGSDPALGSLRIFRHGAFLRREDL